MGKNSNPNYTSAIVVAHGESEEIIAKHIRSSLRLNIYIHRRKTSIQINGLLHELKTNYANINALKRNSHIEVNIEKKKPVDFKIFTLMDTDDCLEDTKIKYMDKQLFEGYVLKDYIFPIYTSPDLENVLFQCGLIPKIFNDSEKVKEYGKLFPVCREPKGKSRIDDMIKLSEALKTNNNTNLYEFIDYCIEQAKLKKIQ